MDALGILEDLELTGAAYAAPISGGQGIGINADALVTPASVIKIPVALAVENAIVAGTLDGSAGRVLSPVGRTPGPVGISLMHDAVCMSVRDLVIAMLTISDNVATDELIALVGLAEVNRTVRDLGMTRTVITSDLRDMLDVMATDAGFTTYADLLSHDPDTDGPPSPEQISTRLAASSALDPTRGSRTTAAESVALLQAIWTDRAGAAPACARVREIMSQQLTRHRIASAFGPDATVFAKSGGLMGVVRNEVGVVAFPDRRAYAVAVFTRREPGIATDPRLIDAGIGRIAYRLIEQLRGSGS